MLGQSPEGGGEWSAGKPASAALSVQPVEASTGGVNGPVFVEDQKVEQAAVRQAKSELHAHSPQIGHFQVIESGNATLDLEVGGHRFVFFVREVLIDGQAVVCTSE